MRAPADSVAALTTLAPPTRAAPPAARKRRARAAAPAPGDETRAKLVASAAASADELMASLGTSRAGLAAAEAARRLAADGANEIAAEGGHPWAGRLARALRNPLVVLLAVLGGVALATGDRRAASVIALMILIGVALRWVQESRADDAAARLRAMIRITAAVVRDGGARELPLRDLVRGDVVELAAGDMIPADVRLLESKDLFVNQASLTGESLPVEKTADAVAANGRAALELPNLCFLGTSVQSGVATAAVVLTGTRTVLGGVAHGLELEGEEPTAFDRGVNQFTWLMIRLIAVMVPLVFLINGLTKGDWHEAFFFALAVAVGLTPELLPMIVSVCLAKGAIAMSRERVIVKRLDAIQNFGAMDVLCTDKTGTLTRDAVILQRHCTIGGEESEDVLIAAALVSHFQTGLDSVLDRAILEHCTPSQRLVLDTHRKVDEIPFDFERKLMSVVVARPDGTTRLIAKGAPEEIIRRCTRAVAGGRVTPVADGSRDALGAEYRRLSDEGFRVLAVAWRDVPARARYGHDDEAQLVLAGYAAFLDPPKESAAPALAALRDVGVTVKVLSGDNERVTRTICAHVGLTVGEVVTGTDVERLADEELGAVAERSTVFARLEPGHKQRIIEVLRDRGHVVGFLGDGINDAPALRAADVGVSVDTAVDVARGAADIILLEKSLLVLRAGVLEGRKVFSNILKYVRMGASSNFGNMFSVLGASALLPFVPMAPIQVLTNNLLYDLSQVPIPTDNVDATQIARPRPWHMGEIGRFIALVGPISSVFDYTTYAALYFLLGASTPARAALFHTGWFVESLLTQTLVIHVIRTDRIPFLQSRPSVALMLTTAAIVATALLLPISPFASALGFVPLPAPYWPILAATVVLYLAATQLAKGWMAERGWI